MSTAPKLDETTSIVMLTYSAMCLEIIGNSFIDSSLYGLLINFFLYFVFFVASAVHYDLSKTLDTMCR